MANEMMYGASRVFGRVVELVDGYAPFPWPVLLLGETGVGKELFARRIHHKSTRSAGPFVPVNCGAIPAGLFESELFGHERGAFSGATQGSRGMVRAAAGGTLFLDEVGELDLSLQVKLLRLLDLGEIRAVGSTKTEIVNVRIVAATNVDLTGAIRAGRFRHDLLERLSVLTADVPPLRERREDIPLIARHLLRGLECEISDEALGLLAAYGWSGNIRQLRNVLVRGCVRGRGAIGLKLAEALLMEECAREASTPVAVGDLLEGTLANIEKQVIVEKLKQCRGNRKKAATELGIAKSTLHEKLRRWKSDGTPGWPISRFDAGAGLSV